LHFPSPKKERIKQCNNPFSESSKGKKEVGQDTLISLSKRGKIAGGFISNFDGKKGCSINEYGHLEEEGKKRNI